MVITRANFVIFANLFKESSIWFIFVRQLRSLHPLCFPINYELNYLKVKWSFFPVYLNRLIIFVNNYIVKSEFFSLFVIFPLFCEPSFCKVICHFCESFCTKMSKGKIKNMNQIF